MTKTTRGVLGLLAVVSGAALCIARPIAAQGEAVTLAYKFKMGRTVHSTMTMNGKLDMGLNLGGAQQQLPITMDMTARATQKVTAVGEDGAGTVNQTIDGMKMDMAMLNMFKITMELENGELVLSVNGQKQAVPNMPGIPTAKDITEPTVMKVAPTGKVLSTMGGASKFLSSVPGGGAAQFAGFGGLAFPAEAKAVGQSWDTRDTVQMPFGIPGQGGGGNVPVEVTTHNTLKSIDQKAGHRIAVIDTTGKVALPRGAKGGGGGMFDVSAMTISFTSTSQFDLDQGEPTSQNGNVTMNMTLSLNQNGQKIAMDMKGDLKIGTTYAASGE